MSTNNQRIVFAIQRLARNDPDSASAIDAATNRGGYDSEGSRAESSSDSRICCDGSTSGNANPGMSSRNPDDEGAGQDASGGLDPNSPANLDMGAGSLTGLTNCVTDDPVCFEGDDWLPPEGWESPTQPGPAPSYEAGCYWRLGGNLNRYSSWREAYEERLPPGWYYVREPIVEDDPGSCAGYYVSPGNIADGQGSVIGTSNIYSYECGEIQDDYCTVVPLADTWPEDGCVNLGIKGGKIVGSKYDPENDGSYSAPRDSISLCDDYGNSFDLAPSASGGWKTISSQNPGDGYLYDSQGNQIARISESEYSDPNV
ncbi:hypothetical protein [Halomonas getboli]|uniref:hypothetical protein n=1 Tax=Halomonas getboli TaxID=2935862 RepID=UPI001FFFA7FB|nr:hypothetical protein [Halomonas getboli]MCK2183495.1 hypothetical protein [Halomonas getboli]